MNFTLPNYIAELKQLIKNQFRFNYQLNYQLFKTKGNRTRKIKCRYQYA